MNRAPSGWLRAAFALNVLLLLFAIYCAWLIISFRYCPFFGPPRCDPWASHLPDALRALAIPGLAMAGTLFGVRYARADEGRRAIRALLGWSALSLAALMSFVLVPMA